MTASLCCAVAFLLLCEAGREPVRTWSWVWSAILRICAVVFICVGLTSMVEDIMGALS